MTITIQNYKQLRKGFNLSKLNKEALNTFNEVDSDFDDMLELYTDTNPANDVIREMLDGFISFVNKSGIASSKEKKSPKPKGRPTKRETTLKNIEKHPPRPKPKPKKVPKKPHTTKYKTGDYLYWFENDGRLIKEKIYKIGKNSKGQNIYTVVGPKETWQYSEKEITDAIKKGDMSLNKPPVKYVNFYTEEYKLLRRYYNLINSKKQVSFRRVQLLFFAFEKAFAARKVRKTSKNANLLNQVNTKLVNVYTLIKKEEEDVIFSKTDKKLNTQLKKYITSYKTDPAVLLLNRYIAMQGDNPDIDKAKRLLNAITNAINKQRVKTSNRLYKQLLDAKKDLHKYVNTKQAFIKPKAQGLTGKKKISKGLGNYKREAETLTIKEAFKKRSITLQSAADILKTPKPPTQYFKMSGDIANFFGKIEKKPKHSVAITIDAPQGAMKTRLLFQLANALVSKANKVLFVSLEEHPQSQLFTDKQAQYIEDKYLHNFYPLGDLENGFETLKPLIKQFDVILIDSWNKIKQLSSGIDFDHDLRKAYNGKLFVTIFQRTQQGLMRGGSNAQFDGDIITKIQKEPSYKDNYAYFDKHRYQDKDLNTLHYNIYSQQITTNNHENSK